GPQSRGDKIPANADLVFVIQIEGSLAIEDIKVGEGEPATPPFVPVTSFVITGADGKELQRTDPGKYYVWIPGEVGIPQSGVEAIQMGLEGMKVGGKRRVTIPKELNVSPPQAQTTRPQNIPITLEVELVALRNLPGQQARGR